jgi:hypothetical protein
MARSCTVDRLLARLLARDRIRHRRVLRRREVRRRTGSARMRRCRLWLRRRLRLAGLRLATALHFKHLPQHDDLHLQVTDQHPYFLLNHLAELL